jgi:ABC-type glycerol-3-phosphate transport system permease component
MRWLCTIAAGVALVVVLFPVYAIIVGSFESTETLFSGTFYWLPHAATLDNYRTVLQGGSASTEQTVGGSQVGHVLTSLIIGLGTACG